MTKINSTDLIKAAYSASSKAYAPYSNYKVGAALLTADGTIFTGCNVENASYGLTLCAERSAVASAVSADQTNFLAIAIYAAATDGKPPYPCGACRQVLAEFCDKNFYIYTSQDDKGLEFTETTLGELLPNAFGS